MAQMNEEHGGGGGVRMRKAGSGRPRGRREEETAQCKAKEPGGRGTVGTLFGGRSGGRGGGTETHLNPDTFVQ